MYRLRKYLWRFMVIFSFIVNIVLVTVLLVVLLLIFDIKQNVANPLLRGLHSSFVGLQEATIDWTIPVRADVPVNLNVPINSSTISGGSTVVTLTENVPIQITGANIVAPGLTVSNATVNISLPAGTRLPVDLNIDLALNTSLPVNLDVRAVIPLGQTQLLDPVENLRLVFEPIVRLLDNLPDDFGETGEFVTQILSGNAPDLLAPSAYSLNPWPGFSRTAGVNYRLYSEPVPLPNRPIMTGIVPEGGIPALDEAIRPEVWEQGGPGAVNEAARTQMSNRSIEAFHFDGNFGAETAARTAPAAAPILPPANPGSPGVASPPPTPGGDMGIVTPPGG